MNKLLFSMLLLLSSITSIYAQPAAEAPTALEKSLLWEISGNELEAPSYLYGTIHMINKKDFFLTENTQKAFDAAEQVAFEIDMEEMTDFSKLMPLMMKAFMRGDTTLSDLLTDEEYELVETHFKKVGLPLMFVERIKPMFLSAMTSEDMFSGDGSQQEVVSYEMEFMSMAQKKELDVQGLETAAYQMSMFDSIPYKVQAQMLVGSLQAGDEGDDQFEQMIELYTTQDIEGMQSLMDEEDGMKEYENLLLVNRNRNWIPVMQEMMGKGTTFFAVGAGHLAGEQGVIRLLQAAGYTLKPLY